MKYYRGRLVDHIHLKVSDIKKSREFYSRITESLGFSLTDEGENQFWIDELHVIEEKDANMKIHLAFEARSAAQVNLFYETALLAGGVGKEAPGLTTRRMNEYVTHVIDPDGNTIEAIYHGPTRRSAQYIEIAPSFVKGSFPFHTGI